MTVQVTEGVGKTVATETLGGLQYQQVKITGGQVGSTSMLGVNPDGSINTSIIGIPTVLIGGSIAAVVTSNPNQSVSGSITFPAGSVANIANPAGSVTAVRMDSASVIAIVQGSVTAIPTGNQSISGAVTAQAGSVMTVATLAGSVMAVSATAPAGSIMSVTAPAGSVMAVSSSSPAGSIAAVTITSIATAGQVMGSVAALQGTNPWTTVRPAGSVTAIANIAGSIAAVSATSPAGSVLTVATLAGSVMAVSATAPAASIMSVTNPAGSVTGVRTDNASIIAVFQNSSIFTNQTGSVIAVIQGSSILAVPVGSTITVLQAPSIVGTYAEDAASANADKGVFVLGVRNDTLASVTSADGDYGAYSLGPSGEMIVANSPLTKWIQGTADFRQGNAGGSIQLIAVGGTSIFTYITGVQVANLGSASVLVTLASSGSTLGYTIAPAGGGSNILYPNALKTPSNGNFAASLSGIASVLVSAQGFISKS